MCLIIANVDGRPIPNEFIKSAFRSNDDGFGVMWATPQGQLKIVRNVYKDPEQIITVLSFLSTRKLPYVAHFRMATHGPVVKDNCHPFRISDSHGGIGMVHNGCFSGYEFYSHPTKSDTAVMADKIAEHLNNGHFSTRDLFTEESPEFTKRYYSSFGWSRMAFMNGDGDINILNEASGAWINGVWYSNEYGVGSHNVKANNYRVISGISVINNPKALELVLAGDHPDELEEISDDDILDDDVTEMFGRAFCEAGTEFDIESEKDDDEIMHPFASADGYSSSGSSRQSPKSFFFEGVEYDLTEEATFLSEEDIQEAIDGAENGSVYAANIVEDLVHRAMKGKEHNGSVVNGEWEDESETIDAKGNDDDDDDENAWKQFVLDYNKSKNRGSLALPANTDKTEESHSSVSSTTYGGYSKNFSTTTNGSHRFSYSSSLYSSSESVSGYYSKPNDPIDQIVEALLSP